MIGYRIYNIAISEQFIVSTAGLNGKTCCRYNELLRGSVFTFSVNTGEFIEKFSASDSEADDLFGSSVCASKSEYILSELSVMILTPLQLTFFNYLFNYLRSDVV